LSYFKAAALSTIAGVEVFLVVKDKKKIKFFQTPTIGKHFESALNRLELNQTSMDESYNTVSSSDDSDDSSLAKTPVEKIIKTDQECQCDLKINKHFKLSTPMSLKN
jgi:hypothetical protein